MRRIMMAVIPGVALLVGCGDSSNPPAQVATLTQAQIDSEEKREKEVSAAEKLHDKTVEKAAYVPLEEAIVNDAEREHAAESRAARGQKGSPQRR